MTDPIMPAVTKPKPIDCPECGGPAIEMRTTPASAGAATGVACISLRGANED